MQLLPITNATILDHTDVCSSERIRDTCRSILTMYPDGKATDPWLGYLGKGKGEIIGACGFKTAPVNNCVEIAYFTFPEFEGKGYATKMATRLIAIAQQHGIYTITSHTLPQVSASTRILEKLGFIHTGNARDEKNREVWQWKLSISA